MTTGGERKNGSYRVKKVVRKKREEIEKGGSIIPDPRRKGEKKFCSTFIGEGKF